MSRIVRHPEHRGALCQSNTVGSSSRSQWISVAKVVSTQRQAYALHPRHKSPTGPPELLCQVGILHAKGVYERVLLVYCGQPRTVKHVSCRQLSFIAVHRGDQVGQFAALDLHHRPVDVTGLQAVEDALGLLDGETNGPVLRLRGVWQREDYQRQ